MMILPVSDAKWFGIGPITFGQHMLHLIGPNVPNQFYVRINFNQRVLQNWSSESPVGLERIMLQGRIRELLAINIGKIWHSVK
ncbi:hypothetical protein CRP01_19965 [Flavilitoribacter nigricans DSM 23189 = NBRC 102662]|uniref:Uncharacterized protein n=1 Tax=Flavilitoribacter nigricans (strain ATCC 23147 / DSM 23189 / NBRC 102662 / NCIMB 1420 / SS-2) TaxID=1122177 RepID=A0A2D0N8S9_FLAN2|nr:hypothetical protein CRP01_19965 [Flavilitoribacter nigricans DSM 23189 = NBRC 102662]